MSDTDDIELPYETLERFAMAVESWPAVLAQEEYEAMVAEEKERIRKEMDKS